MKCKNSTCIKDAGENKYCCGACRQRAYRERKKGAKLDYRRASIK